MPSKKYNECSLIEQLENLPRIEGRPDRDSRISEEDIFNLKIELGLLEENKISFKQFLGRV